MDAGSPVYLPAHSGQPFGLGTLTVDTQHTLQFEDTVGLFDNTEEDHAGEAGHPDWVGNPNLTLIRDLWSFYWGVNYVGETDNFESFGTSKAGRYGDERVDLVRTALLPGRVESLLVPAVMAD